MSWVVMLALWAICAVVATFYLAGLIRKNVGHHPRASTGTGRIRNRLRGMLNLLLVAQAFLAPVMPADTLRVGVVGDNQLNAFNTFGTICTRLSAERIDLFVGLGDHVQDRGLPGEWQRLWLAPLAPIAGVPRIGAIGNHDDVLGYTANVWPSQQHPLTSPHGNAIAVYSAVTVGNVRFVFLDTNEHPTIRLSLQPGGSQRIWLDSEIAGAAWGSARWRVVCFHHPAITELWDGGCLYPLQAERAWVMDRLSGGSAHLVLSGHSHALQRGTWRGVLPFVVSGGGGGWLDTTRCWDHPEITVATAQWHYCILDITPDTLTVTAKNTAGVAIDTLTIR